MLAIALTAANVGDRPVMADLLRKLGRLCPTVRHLWADRGYTRAPSLLERTTLAHEAHTQVSQIALMLRRVDRVTELVCE